MKTPKLLKGIAKKFKNRKGSKETEIQDAFKPNVPDNPSSTACFDSDAAEEKPPTR